MCGRFVAADEPHLWADLLQAAEIDETLVTDWRANFNVAPSSDIAVAMQNRDGRALKAMKWGISPPWNDDGSLRPINARSETVLQKPFFKSSMNKRRCVVPVNGYYEWKSAKNSDRKSYKQPWYITIDRAEFSTQGDSFGEAPSSVAAQTTGETSSALGEPMWLAAIYCVEEVVSNQGGSDKGSSHSQTASSIHNRSHNRSHNSAHARAQAQADGASRGSAQIQHSAAQSQPRTSQQALGSPDSPNQAFTVALLTQPAQGLISEVHHRMPMFVDSNQIDAWLDVETFDSQEMLGEIANQTPPVVTYSVSTMVNNAKNHGANLIEPYRYPQQQRLF